VKVTTVRTVTTHGKVVRRGLNATRKANIKKAYVTLKEGEKIALFEGV
jgi:large subunit ribosomal protein L23